jgi:uncharacterized protein YkwD
MPSTMPLRVAVLALITSLALLATIVAASPVPADAASRCAGANREHQSFKRARHAIACLINRERAKRGLRPLRYDHRLAKVARVHAHDMIRFRFLGHNSPKHGSLTHRVQHSGYGRGRAFTIGEILGAGLGPRQTPAWIVNAWMHRPIHSKAILYPTFRRFGVGAVRGMPNGRRRGRNFVVTFGS